MNPTLLDSMGWRMAEVYGAVTDRLLINLARYFPYIKGAGEVKGAFEYQARMLAQMGQVTRESADIIMGSLGGADQALRDALEAFYEAFSLVNDCIYAILVKASVIANYGISIENGRFHGVSADFTGCKVPCKAFSP